MLSFSHDDRVAVWTLSRPPVNAIDNQWIDSFNAGLDEIETRDSVSAMLIRSDQKVFCAGFDLKHMRSHFGSDSGHDALIEDIRRLQALYARIEALPLVTVAEIAGTAFGGGLELALACDLRLAADEARMGLPECALGLLPGGGGTQRLTRLCGRAIAFRVILGAEHLDGRGAEQLGVVQWSAPRDALAAMTDTLMDGLAVLPRHALAEAKRCILVQADPAQDGFEAELAGTRRLLDNPETQARVAAFLDRSK